MLFDLPDRDSLYAALLARDARFDGQVYVCVTTTGVFCRLTCPARKPRRENCTFYRTIGDCMAAGFRPCKRCRPLEPEAMADPAVTCLMHALESSPDVRWSERHVKQMGFDPSTVRRTFKRQFGKTFLEMARQRRLGVGFKVLSEGGQAISAQHEAGFDSASAFRAAFARLLGCSPGEMKQGGILRASWIGTPLGDMIAVASRSHLHLLEFVDRKALPAGLKKLRLHAKEDIGIGRYSATEQAEEELKAFFEGRSAAFSTPLSQPGSAFSRSVWEELRHIPAGESRSYLDIAKRIGRPEAVRAVARANGANQIALMVPCHRVIGADGSLTGYGGGLWRKQRLLEIEIQYNSTGMDSETDDTKK